MKPLFISIPAFGKAYVDLAVRYTIPGVLASLRECEGEPPPTFIVHTDDRAKFQAALPGQKIEFMPLAPPVGRDGPWHTFKQAHRDAIAKTPQGAILALLNSDIVISRETFAFVDQTFANNPDKKVIVSVGIRTLIDGNTPPIGVSAAELNRWIWTHRHPITDECIWQGGRSHHPTILFFEQGSEVSMHCFHLTPMFIVKDARVMQFKGTIDDDLLERYQEDEICFARDGEMAFAELSPKWKTHPFGKPLSVDAVINFGERRFRPSHVRNFRQRYAVIGRPAANHPVVDQILERIAPR